MKGWQHFTCGEMHNIAGITEIHLPTKHRRTAQELETLANSCSSTKIEYVPVNALAGWPQICMTDDQAPFARIWIFENHIILTQIGRGWVSRFTAFVLFQKYPESCGWGFSLNDFSSRIGLISRVLLYVCGYDYIWLLKLSSSHLFPIFFSFKTFASISGGSTLQRGTKPVMGIKSKMESKRYDGSLNQSKSTLSCDFFPLKFPYKHNVYWKII